MYFRTQDASEAYSEEDSRIWPAFKCSSSSLFQDSWYLFRAAYPLPLLTLVGSLRQMQWNMWLGMSAVLSGRHNGKRLVNLCFIFASFSLRSSWNARPSIQSQTAAIMGPGKRHPASAGAPEFSRVGVFGTQIFFGVGGGMVHCVPEVWGFLGGGFRRSKLEHLSMAVHSWASITIGSDERNGIPSIMGNDNPLFTFILCTPDFHIPWSDCSSSLTYSSQTIFCCIRDDMLSSLLGRGYR